WSFVPAGFNLHYDLGVIANRSKELLNIDLPFHLMDVPKIDLKPIAILANKGKFRGSSLALISGKSSDYDIVNIIEKRLWDELEAYIKDEAKSFLAAYSALVSRLPPMYTRS
ncbi:MAG: hypothetical protein ACXAB7_17590, partial [Candidatus Kariarchaeaceae archaeon]